MEVIEEKPFIIDQHPQTPEQDDTPILLTVGPMLTMGMSSVVLLISSINSLQSNNGSIFSVLPSSIMALSMLAGTILWPSLSKNYTKRKKEKKKIEIEKKYSEYLNKKEAELTEIEKVQGQILLSNNISPLDCYQIIKTKNKNLWMRELHQDDFLTLRVGIGQVPLKISFTYPEEHFKLDQDNLDDKMKNILEKHKNINGVPVTISLTEKNIIAVIGEYSLTKKFMDLMLLQMITFHSYYDLKIVLFTSEAKAANWQYLKQMPHTFKNDKLMRFYVTNFDDGKEISQYLLSIFNAREESVKKDNNDKKDQYKRFDSY